MTHPQKVGWTMAALVVVALVVSLAVGVLS